MLKNAEYEQKEKELDSLHEEMRTINIECDKIVNSNWFFFLLGQFKYSKLTRRFNVIYPQAQLIIDELKKDVEERNVLIERAETASDEEIKEIIRQLQE